MQTTSKLLSSLAESTKLTYEKQLTLKALSEDGLTEEMLLNREGYFGYYHYEALCQLVKKRGFTIQAALKEIEGLNFWQVHGIESGLTRDDVKPLFNSWHIIALAELKSFGLTNTMLLDQTKYWGDEVDDEHYCYALCHLIEEKKFTIQAAFKEIEALTPYQAMGIEEGLTRNDVISLKNFWHIEALVKLKKHGLMPEMLLNRNDGGYPFDYEHCYALRDLVIEKKFTIQDALKIIEGVSRAEARHIREGNYIPERNKDRVLPPLRR